MRVGSLAAGALTNGARGRVASVHRRAVNLLMEAGSLVALLPEGTPIHPWALAAPVHFSGLTPGDAVAMASGVLQVGALRVSLDGAQSVELRLRSRPSTWPAGQARTIAEFLARRPLDSPFDALLSEALTRFGAGGEARDLVSLVGLGEGLTPSGDDALVGVLAGLDALVDVTGDACVERGALVAAIGPVIAERTTALSAQMLAAAAAGLYAEPVVGMVHALSAETAAVEEAANALLGMGHRSGEDTLRGLAAALAWAQTPAGYL